RPIGPGEISDVWALEPAGLEFAQPLTVTIPLYETATDVESAAISWTDATTRRLPTVVGGLAATATVEMSGTGEAVPRLRVTDSFEVPGNAVDILLVVDDSCSMSEEQTQLASLAAGLVERLDAEGVDYHIGVTTTDTFNQPVAGKLRPMGANERYLTPLSPDAVGRLASAVQVGTEGHYDECGREAAYMVLETRATLPANLGFRRPDVPLEILFYSDEDDQTSLPTRADFRAWVEAMPVPVVLHAVTGLSGSTCQAVQEPGTDYIAYTNWTGGVLSDLCNGPGPSVAALGATASPESEVQLSFPPEPDSLVVTHSADAAFGRLDVGPLDSPQHWWIASEAPGTVTFSYLPVDPQPH
ncbi:MAG: hypothetical protein KC656_11465, partial [Myxococcales bacterium]|nr:hypothetical protein [Myxococcales bacterium]